MTPTTQNLHDAILGLAIQWAPLGGPTSERIRDLFQVDTGGYRRRLADAIRLHRNSIPERTLANLERVYGSIILESGSPRT